jgi:subtilisin family serine protease
LKRYLKFVPLLCLLLAGSVTTHAQQGPQGFAAIVVFKDNAPFQAFAPNYRADDRAAANPAAWNYLDRGVVGTVQTLENLLGFRAEHVYSAAIRGFSARLTARQIQDLRNDSMVAYVEQDGEMAAVAQTLPWGIDRIDADASSTQAGNGGGAVTNVNVYVIDTGVDFSHPDLNGVLHVNFAGGPNKDCHGHGTHVAGTIAAKDDTQDVVGVAPGAPITGVKVLGCGGSGTTSGVIKGVDFVTKNAVKPAVANMSLGGGASTALDSAVTSSAASGVFYSLAAGNSGANACNSSPARAGAGNNGIVTTAATDVSNIEASWSNFGSCIDIHAPGVGVLSTKKGGGTTTMSGTSMASPHSGGAGALYLSNNTTATPTTVEQTIKARATTPGTTSKDGSAIKLLNVSTF